MASCVTFEYIRKNPDIRTYIQRADEALKSIGYTEHSFPHVEKAAATAARILTELGYPKREIELARIAGFLHDIGNVINRVDHAQSGAVMAFRLLDRLEMPVDEICSVISAIGNHDEATAQPIDAISAALILADKTDVNYAVETAELLIDKEQQEFVLSMTIDTQISSVLEYFEIFMERMLLCRRAAQFFHMQFKIYINHSLML